MRKDFLGKMMAMAVLATMIALGAGCAAKIDSTFTQPEELKIDNSRVYNESYDKVWKAVVDSVGQSFFILENIEKDSGIMSISFVSKEPNKYIDCGNITDFGSVYGKKYEISYAGAAPLVTRKIVSQTGVAFDVIRAVEVGGKANITVNKLGEKTTKVTVTTRYIVRITQAGDEPIPSPGFGQIMRPVLIRDELSFTGSEAGMLASRNGMVCRSTMELEQAILNGITKKL
jgi:hypothetical protein